MTFGSGSFRDPENAAVHLDGGWYRVAAPASAEALNTLRHSDLYTELVGSGSLVRFEHCDPETAERVLEHYRRAAGRSPSTDSSVFSVESVDVLSYPWEWPNALLQEAGLLTLEIRDKLLGIGLDLKDASAFNIQFRGMTPVLIDLGSVETWRPNPSWNAARQYVEHFINPLAVGSGPHVTSADAWDLSHRRGLKSDVARALLPKGQRRKPSLWVLQTSTKPVEKNSPVEVKYGDQARQQSDLAKRASSSLTRRLRKHTLRLGGGDHATTWQDYGGREHYGTDDLQRKVELTRAFIQAEPDRRRLVLDVGGNDGLAAADLVRNTGARVVVADADTGALDVLIRGAGQSPELAQRMTPLYADLTNLTPASGLLDTEFSAFTDRVRPSAVICQAVLHHVVITQGVPMPLAVAALARFGAPLLVEFAEEDDDKVELLLSQIPNWTGTYSLEALLGALEEYFHDVAVAGKTSATRVVVTTGNPTKR